MAGGATIAAPAGVSSGFTPLLEPAAGGPYHWRHGPLPATIARTEDAVSRDPPLMVSHSGIRGIVGRSLTGDTVRRFAAAFAAGLPAGSRVVLARDTRPSGEDFAGAAASALQEAGCAVLDLGVCATPAAKMMVLQLAADGAVILTASHNPAEWNGLKLIRGDGIFLDAEGAGQVEAAFHRGDRRRAPGGRLERVPREQVEGRLLERILDVVDAGLIRRAGLRAAVDPCNGTGALFAPRLLEALGVEPVFIHAEPDGRFAHDPEPVPANLADLGRAVLDHGCHAGFAIDPDADRVALVGEDGRPLGEDLTLALAVQVVTRRRRGPVVTTLSTSQVVSDAAEAAGCPVTLTPVGEVHVVDAMIAEGAVIGGEGNGGVILTEVDPGRDAAVGMALVLEALAVSGRSLTGLAAALPAYHIEKRRVDADPAGLEGALSSLARRYPGAFRHPVADGGKLYLGGRLECPWVHLRASNTEPVVRVMAESADPEEAARLCDEAEGLLAGG